MNFSNSKSSNNSSNSSNNSNNGSNNNSKIMNINDIVIIYERYDNISYIILESYGVLENKYGIFYHNNFIGKQYGSKIYSKNKNGWLYALEPTPELWSIAMHTRTQIVDDSDASYVTFSLDVFPGCKVVESGTGSGNMTLSLARAVAPHGHVYSYEYNETRANEAKKEFESLRVSDLITVQCTDVCATEPDSLLLTSSSSSSSISSLPYEQQFGFIGCESNSIDAVFLDLPEPWKAIPHAYRILKSGRSICCYSPCMEQVNKTCAKLRELNFHSIRMTEVRQRPFEGRKISFSVPDLGQTDIIPINIESKQDQDQVQDQEKQNIKDDEEVIEGDQNSDNTTIGKGKRRRNQYETREFPPRDYLVGRAITPMKGHTAFLTFAVCPEKKLEGNNNNNNNNEENNSNDNNEENS